MGLFWCRYLSPQKIMKENIVELNKTTIIYTIENEIYIKNFDDEIKDKCFEILQKVYHRGFTYIDYYDTTIYSITEYNDVHYLYNSSKISPTTYGWTLNND